jgi:hypothetical protein
MWGLGHKRACCCVCSGCFVLQCMLTVVTPLVVVPSAHASFAQWLTLCAPCLL